MITPFNPTANAEATNSNVENVCLTPHQTAALVMVSSVLEIAGHVFKDARQGAVLRHTETALRRARLLLATNFDLRWAADNQETSAAALVLDCTHSALIGLTSPYCEIDAFSSGEALSAANLLERVFGVSLLEDEVEAALDAALDAKEAETSEGLEAGQTNQ